MMWRMNEQKETDMTTETIEKIAKSFHSIIREHLDVEERAAVDQENARGEDTCATHDYLDANVYMCEAFEKVMGRDIDHASQADAKLVNAAWDRTIDEGFSRPWA